MRKDKENQPIDDLFARKLGNLSLPPSTDGFERLQARMNQRDQTTKVVVWRNPTVQRYLAVAACLLVVCSVGWLYWSNTNQNNSQMVIEYTHRSLKNGDATHENGSKEALAKTERSRISRDTPLKTPANTATKVVQSRTTDAHLARVETKPRIIKNLDRPISGSAHEVEPTLAQVHPVNNTATVSQPINANTANPPATERLADNTAKVKPAERVLVVTIEEPAALVAARQVKNSAGERVAQATDADEKEAKGSGIWQQVKRLKQGELFARSGNAANEDQGLLSRAYTGLKQSFDKGKSTKQ